MSNIEAKRNDNSNMSECPPGSQVQLTPTTLSMDRSPERSTSVQSRQTTHSDLQHPTVDACSEDPSSRASQSGQNRKSMLRTALPRLVIPKEERSPGRLAPSTPIPGDVSPGILTPEYSEQCVTDLIHRYPGRRNDYWALIDIYKGLECDSVKLTEAADARLKAITTSTQSGQEAEETQFRTFRKDLESAVPADKYVKWRRTLKDVFDVESGSDVGSDEDE